MKKMLIIEDDKLVGNIYRHRFQAAGFQVTLATDGEAGLRAVADCQPDIVILDLMLPKLNGVEVLKRLRATGKARSLPVIVMSNAYMSALVQEARNAGADHCINKASCTPNHLVDLVNRTLGPLSGVEPTPAKPALKAEPGPTSTSAGMHRRCPPTGAEEDPALQAELRQTFLKSASEELARLRSALQAVIKSDDAAMRLQHLVSLYGRVHSLTSNSAVAGVTSVAKMASALEALLKELHEKPKNLTASTLRTVAHTIDFLGVLLGHSGAREADPLPQPNIMVVDDEAFSRRAVIGALEKANLKCVGVEDPNVALTMLSKNHFDLIFLDVDMPRLNGFELCARLRALPGYARTPVVFVTALTDFESRARSTLSGGNDLIAKPFLFIELAIKALTYVLKGQLGGPGP